MTSWQDIHDAAPDLARRAEAVFTATTNAVLATLRKDGSPRVSGIDPMFRDGELWIGSMPGSRKAADLRRDPRMALHCVPWESRDTDDDTPVAGARDAKLAGRAVAADADLARRIIGQQFDDAGIDSPPEGDLFRIDVERLTTVHVEDDKYLVIETWTPESGIVRVKRE